MITQLGLVGAVRSVCSEMARAHDIEVELIDEEVPHQVSEDHALCLYRIVQEGLNNATRHGGAPRATVKLEATAKEILLEIRDEGTGFDPTHLDAPGIGLAGMRERAHHLGGRFELYSRPGSGTRITVRLPTV